MYLLLHPSSQADKGRHEALALLNGKSEGPPLFFHQGSRGCHRCQYCSGDEKRSEPSSAQSNHVHCIDGRSTQQRQYLKSICLFIMRFIVIPLFLFSVLLFANEIDAFAAKNKALQQPTQPNSVRRTDSKTDHLAQCEHQQVARNANTGPEAKHHTNREEVPGRHRETAWFQRPAHKPKTDEKENETPSGRKWTFGKVPRW